MTTVSRDEVWELFREVARRFEETDRKFQDTDRKFQDTDRKFQETDRKFQDTDRKFQKTRQEIKKVNESVGRLGNRLGDFVEEMVKPAAIRFFQTPGMYVVHRDIHAWRDGDEIEIDLLVVNNTDMIAIECKSLLSQDDVNQHIQNLTRLKKLLPSYQDKTVMGAVAAMVLPDQVARYAYKQGLYVIAQSGDHLFIRNDDRFVPKCW